MGGATRQTLGIHGIAASSDKISWDFRVKDGPAQGSGDVDYSITAFNFHQITRVDIYPDRIFDPSYGTLTIGSDGRSVNLTWEDENVIERLRGGLWIPDTKGTLELIYH